MNRRERRPKTINERDLQTLNELKSANDQNVRSEWREGWATPMECGGTDGSHHSKTLQKLIMLGLVEVKDPNPRKPWRSRLGGGAYYKITADGIAKLARIFK